MFKSEIEEKIENCLKLSEFTIDRRNRLSAHLDLDLAIKEGAKPLEDINRNQIENAIESINTLLNKIEVHYLKSETFFKIRTSGCADHLVFNLKYSIQQQEKKKKRVLQGKTYPEDLEPPSAI